MEKPAKYIFERTSSSGSDDNSFNDRNKFGLDFLFRKNFLERKEDIIFKYSLYFLLIIYSVGIAGHLIPEMRNLMIALTPATLFITGSVVLFNIFSKGNKKLLFWMIFIFAVTFTAEVIGVHTGLVFGSYTYGDVLGVRLFSVPLIIGLNWVLIILGAILLANKITGNLIASALIAGFLAFVFDFILEPSAVNLGYWSWEGGVIPLQNYISWFSLAFVSGLLFNLMKIKVASKLPVYYLLIQSVFFLTLLFFID